MPQVNRAELQLEPTSLDFHAETLPHALTPGSGLRVHL